MLTCWGTWISVAVYCAQSWGHNGYFLCPWCVHASFNVLRMNKNSSKAIHPRKIASLSMLDLTSCHQCLSSVGGSWSTIAWCYAHAGSKRSSWKHSPAQNSVCCWSLRNTDCTAMRSAAYLQKERAVDMSSGKSIQDVSSFKHAPLLCSFSIHNALLTDPWDNHGAPLLTAT